MNGEKELRREGQIINPNRNKLGNSSLHRDIGMMMTMRMNGTKAALRQVTQNNEDMIRVPVMWCSSQKSKLG